MKRTVRVKMHSLIKSIEENGETIGEPYVGTTDTEGELEFFDGRAVLTWFDESDGVRVDARITVEDGCVRLSNRGGIKSNLYFRAGAKYTTVYEMLGYAFDATVVSEPPSVKLSENGGEIKIGYTMNLGGDLRIARLRISVSPTD